MSVANNLLADQVRYHLDANSAALKSDVDRLASGLRIESAADDPSGLAIATTLQTQATAFTTAVQNVQNADSAAAVALGALTTTTSILQRIRSLAVEAASDVESESDRADLQAEVSQLLLEIDRIAQNTSFNGEPLLDGTHAGFVAEQPAYLTVTANAVLATAGDGGILTGLPPGTVTHSGDIVVPPALTYPVPGLTAGKQYALTFTATSATSRQYSLIFDFQFPPIVFQAHASPSGTAMGPLIVTADGADSFYATQAGGVGSVTLSNVTFTPLGATGSGAVQVAGVNTGLLVASAVASGANFNTTPNVSLPGIQGTGGAATVDGSIEIRVVNTGVSVAAQEIFIASATGAVCVSTTLFAPDSVIAGTGADDTKGFDNVKITLGNFTTADVGATSFIKVSQNVAAITSSAQPAFTVQSAADEGDVIRIGIPGTSTRVLRLSNINLAISSSVNPSLGAEDAIGQVDIALRTLLEQQAELGATAVRLNEDASNDGIASVNLHAAESSIRDVQIGAATTDLTRRQILVQIDTSVLAQANTSPTLVLRLFR